MNSSDYSRIMAVTVINDDEDDNMIIITNDNQLQTLLICYSALSFKCRKSPVCLGE